MALHSLYPIATGSEDLAVELPDIAGGDGDTQEISGAEKANLVPTDTATGEKGASDSDEREKPAAATDVDSGGPQQEEAREAAVPEKLQDDDQLKEIWYKRWFFKVFPMLRRGGCVYSIICVRDREREREFLLVTWNFLFS